MKTVFCQKFKQNLEALEQSPVPGVLGEHIINNTSKKAWGMWVEEQTKIINEKQLNLSSKEDRKFLIEEMKKFLSDENYKTITNFVSN